MERKHDQIMDMMKNEISILNFNGLEDSLYSVNHLLKEYIVRRDLESIQDLGRAIDQLTFGLDIPEMYSFLLGKMHAMLQISSLFSTHLEMENICVTEEEMKLLLLIRNESIVTSAQLNELNNKNFSNISNLLNQLLHKDLIEGITMGEEYAIFPDSLWDTLHGGTKIIGETIKKRHFLWRFFDCFTFVNYIHTISHF